MTAALARLATGHPRRVLAVAALLAVLAGAFGGSVADRLHPYGADDPATDSVRAQERIEDATGAKPHAGLIVLVESRSDMRGREGRRRVAEVARALEARTEVAGVATWFTTRDPAFVSRDRRATYVAARFDASLEAREEQRVARELAHELEAPDLRFGGSAYAAELVNDQVERDLQRAELLAFPLLFALTLLFFRSLVAALLPLLVGGVAIVATFAALRLASEALPISIFALNLTTALGLGLAIDYSLLVVSRFREELARAGDDPDATRVALGATLATAGRTVLFSSLTVAASLAALLTFPQRFLYSMGLGGMTVALIAAVSALVLLPAVLALLGPRVNALAPRRLQRAAERDARPARTGGWYRLSQFVMRRPARVALASGLALVALGSPFLRIDFVPIDETVLPRDTSARQVGDALRADFPRNRATPLRLVAGTGPGPALERLRERVAADPAVASVAPVQPLGDGLSLVEVAPRGEPPSHAAQQLVRRIRALDTPYPLLVGGQTAEFVDLKQSLARHLPLALGIILAATFVLLFLMTGSVVLPVKAALMNVLTISAAFGLLVLIFQDGRLEGLLGYESQGGIEATMPLLLFVAAFGLSTDYAVFLLARIKEARDAGAPDGEAVALGLERTGRIVTAAALLMSVALGALATSEIIFIQQNGIGTAAAVLIDALLVRALLVPSLMELLGRWNWWAPAPLRRLHARVGLRETDPPPAVAALRARSGA